MHLSTPHIVSDYLVGRGKKSYQLLLRISILMAIHITNTVLLLKSSYIRVKYLT